MNIQDNLKACLQENQIIVPSYTHYGGMSGYHDYGIIGTRIKNKFLEMWRKFFLFEEDIDEIETPAIMPYDVLKASGHIDRFTDYVISDKEGNLHRADHLLKDYFNNNNLSDLAAQVESWTPERMSKEIIKHNILKDASNNLVVEKNLMYEVTKNSEYLRPELAQGIFVNYKVVQQFLRRDLPFGIAQIGKSYRKEISPKQFTRMREFTQAEIEYFVDPQNKTYPKFKEIKYCFLPLLTGEMQKNNVDKPEYLSVEDAITKNIIGNEITAYFLVKIYMFAEQIGLDLKKVRFRQHMENEMAHYANECWDLEVYVNGDWMECVGCVDRGSYDLQAHSGTNSMMSKRRLDEPVFKNIHTPVLNMKLIGKVHKSLANSIKTYFENLEQNELEYYKDFDTVTITINDIECELTNEMISVSEYQKKIEFEEFYPHVIEPSFGIDRLLFAMFNHSFYIREGDRRPVLSLKKCLSPYDVAVFQLYNKDSMLEVVNEVRNILKKEGLSCYIDKSNVAIGKRYVRADEIGVKYAITVDPGTLENRTVTIRDRDSMKQIVVPIDNLSKVFKNIENEFNI